MPLSELIAVAPPPREPVAGRGNWKAVEERLGLGLPGDFKALIETYGSGSFSDFLNPINPFRGDGAGFDWADRDILEFDRETRDEYPDALPYPIHPEPGGILPWAETDNGDILYWLTEGDPDSWPILIRESRGPDRVVYPFGAVEFLHRWLSGELTCPIFPNWDVRSDPGFLPDREFRAVTIHFQHADGTFDERLQRLMDHFGSTCIRRRLESTQAIFEVEPSQTRVTYTDLGGGSGARMELAFPPADEPHYKSLVQRIRTQLGWPIRRIRGPEEFSWADVAIDPEPEGIR